jgi:hypothetical protein
LRRPPRRLASLLWLGISAVLGLVALSGLIALSAAAHADAAAGRQAYEKGDYAEAMAEWQAAADKKDPEAEFGLGNLYEFGAGDLLQDYRRAAYWYREAAKRGDIDAEYRLSLIYGAGGDNFASDLAEAEKWADLAVQSHGVWGSLAGDFKKLLDAVTTPEERAEGESRAAAWTAARAVAGAEVAPAAPARPAAPSVKPGGCPGWPFPTLPCTEKFPALAGTPAPAQAPAPPPAQPAAVGPPPGAATPKPPLAALNEALAGFDCASLRGRIAKDGATVVSGTVPDAERKEELLPLTARYFPSTRTEIDVEIVPPPICRTLVALDRLQPSGAAGGHELVLRLDEGDNRLREGDPIDLEVRGPEYPVYLYIDYFSLDGRVLHLKPDRGEPPPRLTAGAARRFGDPANGDDWHAGGAPFGIELIAVVATPFRLNLGHRPQVEEASQYLGDLAQAFERLDRNSATPALIGTLRVETSGR